MRLRHGLTDGARRQVFAGRMATAIAAVGVAILVALACNPGGIGQDEIEVPYTVDPVADERDAAATPRAVDRNLQVFTVTSKDAIPAIRDPEFVNAADAEAWMEAEEPVIGVEIDGEARAYPTAMLSRHEIVNDVLGGAPIAVTW